VLPDKIDELERRIAALERRAAGGSDSACPICNSGDFKRVSAREHPEFGFAGIMLDLYRCSACGHEEDRQRDVAAPH
jgi:C4-type Zn-finger protein